MNMLHKKLQLLFSPSGSNDPNLTVFHTFFQLYPSVERWRFQVQYHFASHVAMSASDFIINTPPMSGSCSISPSSGNQNTVFTVSCVNRYDNDGIEDYAVYRKGHCLFSNLDRRISL
jgi:hypothetical protein